jgi:hypothetical protein
LGVAPNRVEAGFYARVDDQHQLVQEMSTPACAGVFCRCACARGMQPVYGTAARGQPENIVGSLSLSVLSARCAGSAMLDELFDPNALCELPFVTSGTASCICLVREPCPLAESVLSSILLSVGAHERFLVPASLCCEAAFCLPSARFFPAFVDRFGGHSMRFGPRSTHKRQSRP